MDTTESLHSHLIIPIRAKSWDELIEGDGVKGIIKRGDVPRGTAQVYFRKAVLGKGEGRPRRRLLVPAEGFHCRGISWCIGGGCSGCVGDCMLADVNALLTGVGDGGSTGYYRLAARRGC